MRTRTIMHPVAGIVTVALALALTPAMGANLRSVFNPADYQVTVDGSPHSGGLTVASGSIAVNTDDLTLTADGTTYAGTAALSEAYGGNQVEMAVFSFTGDIGISSGVTINLNNGACNRGFVLASRGNITFAGTLTANGGNGQSKAGTGVTALGGRGAAGAEGAARGASNPASNPPGNTRGNGGNAYGNNGYNGVGMGGGGLANGPSHGSGARLDSRGLLRSAARDVIPRPIGQLLKSDFKVGKARN